MFGVINSSPCNVLVQWIVQRNLGEKAGTFLRGRLIDIGCGSKPYKPLFRPFVAEHVGIDQKAPCTIRPVSISTGLPTRSPSRMHRSIQPCARRC